MVDFLVPPSSRDKADIYIVSQEKKQKLINQWKRIVDNKNEKAVGLKEEIKPLKEQNSKLTFNNYLLISLSIILTFALIFRKVKLLISNTIFK